MLHHLDKIRGSIYNELGTLKPYMNYMTLKERREIVYSKALGISNYGLGLYIGQLEQVKDKITSIYMRANRQIYNQPLPLKTKNIWICKKIGVKTPRQMITDAGLKFIHSVVNKQMPPEIFKLLKFPKRF